MRVLAKGKLDTILPSLLWIVCFCARASAVDLIERYPTSLPSEGAAAQTVCEWSFGAEDVYRVSGFDLVVGESLRVKVEAGNAGIGHCADGAVWALIIPSGKPGRATLQWTNGVEEIVHLWLRFHPREVARLFPPETVSTNGAAALATEMRVIAAQKMMSSWQAGGRAWTPPPKSMTVDADTKDGRRRFFSVDREARSAEYISAFEDRAVKRPPAITRALAKKAFDQIWSEFDRSYAMFVLRPEVNWRKLREEHRERALRSESACEFAGVVAEMLKPLRDLHVWLTIAGSNIPVFSRPALANANPAAHRTILGELKSVGRALQWCVTPEKVGFIAIYGWSDENIPEEFDKILEEMRDTRGLIVDVRLNGGGSEPLAGQVAGRFLEREFTYAYSQYRAGPRHTDLSDKHARKAKPRGPWRYERPVAVLIGPRCMSSNESFIQMMTGATNVTTLGERTHGSSGNPKIVPLPLEMTVSVPRWIDYLADGTPLDERGVEPDVRVVPESGGMEGERDDVLTAALERLRAVALPGRSTGP